MKKHAKKSLLIPISVFCIALAVFAACYISQAVFAHADVEEPGVAVTDELAIANGTVPNPNSGTLAAIHLNTGDIFSGSVTDSDGPKPYVAITGQKIMTYSSDVTNFSIGPVEDEDSQVIKIEPIQPKSKKVEANDVNQICTINLSYTFYEYVGATVNYRWADNTWDITINVTPKYYIGFNANGGVFNEDSSGDTIK